MKRLFLLSDVPSDWWAKSRLSRNDGCFPHNQLRDRTLTDRMQIVNLLEMSWLTGMPRETTHRDAGGVFGKETLKRTCSLKGKDFSAAGASDTGGQRRHRTYKESSSELFKVKQKRLTDHSSWYDPEQTSCCACELSTPDSIYFEGEFEPQDFGSLIYHFHPKWLFHNCWRRWCKVMT